MIRKANAVWRGTGRDGAGDLTTASSVLNRTPYSFKTRFEDEPGTNPEELLAVLLQRLNNQLLSEIGARFIRKLLKRFKQLPAKLAKLQLKISSKHFD